MNRLPVLFTAFLLAPLASADWQLDNDASALSFVSVKNGAVVEAHEFHRLSGKVSTGGEADVEVHLDSVDTLIPIRDERMEKMLFEIADFPTASFTASVPVKEVTALPPGGSMTHQLKGKLSLHGISIDASVPVTIVRAGEGAFHVSSDKPLLVTADSFDLSDGIDALREIAGLNAITPVVPVTFALVFRESE